MQAFRKNVHSFAAANSYSHTYEKSFKVIIVGDPSVGKTAFIQRYVQQTHDLRQKATVGVDFSLKVLQWTPYYTIKLQLWDIAGQERFAWVTRVYYKEAHGCIIMFDLANPSSFTGAAKWKADLDSKCVNADGSSIPCLLLANKCDLVAARAVSQSEIEEMTKREGFAAWTDVSAKEDLMVSDAMRYLVEVMLDQDSGNSSGSYATPLEDSIKLEKSDLIPKKKSTCSC